jgi:hypothetical protein
MSRPRKSTLDACEMIHRQTKRRGENKKLKTEAAQAMITDMHAGVED